MLRVKWVYFFLLMGLSIHCFAAVPITIITPYSVKQYNTEFQNAIATLNHDNSQLTREIDASRLFLGKPYLLFPNGEGQEGKYDKGPLYQTAYFDCLTYVSTVIALTKAKSLPQFISLMKKLNYKNGKVSFITRNHFTSADFNINNQKLGYLSDITQQIHAKNGTPVAKVIKSTINKPLWLKTLSPSRIKLFVYPGNTQAALLLKTLRASSTQLKIETVKVATISLNKLYNRAGEANLYLFNQIPAGAIIEIVRLNPKLPYDKLNITHLGIAIPSARGMLFREASSIYNKVTDVPLIAYLRGYRSNSIEYAINIEVINKNAG